MSETKVKQQKGSARRADGAAANGGGKNKTAGKYYLVNTLLFILKLSVILVMIFSLQNLSDMLRSAPFLNSLPPFPALAFSYFAIHVFCMFFFIVWFGSFAQYFKRLGPTLIEIKGFLIYMIAVPLVFVLLAGGVWWSVSRVKIASFIGFPFQWLPNLIYNLYMSGWPFYAFASLTGILLIALMFLVVFLQKPVDKLKPAVKRAAASPPVSEPETKKTIFQTANPEEDEKSGKPIQPKGQPPLQMK